MARTAKTHSRNYHFPQTVEELTERNIRTIADLEESARSKLSNGDRLAARITRFCGTMKFVWMNATFFAMWILLNTVPGIPHIDPYPFIFLTFIVSIQAIFLATFIMIAENRQEQMNERRAQLDLQVNLLAEQESTKLLQLVRDIALKVGVDPSKYPDVSVLEKATRPEKLIEQIEATGGPENGK